VIEAGVEKLFRQADLAELDSTVVDQSPSSRVRIGE